MSVTLDGAPAEVELIVRRFELDVKSRFMDVGRLRVVVEVDEITARILRALCQDVDVKFTTQL